MNLPGGKDTFSFLLVVVSSSYPPSPSPSPQKEEGKNMSREWIELKAFALSVPQRSATRPTEQQSHIIWGTAVANLLSLKTTTVLGLPF